MKLAHKRGHRKLRVRSYGYTLTELVLTLGAIGMLVAALVAICVGCHFLLKFW